MKGSPHPGARAPLRPARRPGGVQLRLQEPRRREAAEQRQLRGARAVGCALCYVVCCV